MAIALSFQELVFSHGKEVVVQTSSIVGEVNKTVFLFFTKHILNLKNTKQ